jgi:hypothetical protein
MRGPGDAQIGQHAGVAQRHTIADPPDQETPP